MDYLLGAALGTLIAGVLSIPAILVEIFDRKHKRNLPLLVDVRVLWGRKFSHPEMFVIALLVHLIIGALFGLGFPLFLECVWLYIVAAWAIVMLVIFPAIGFGLFGRREGKMVWLEVLITVFLIGLILRLVVNWFQPFFFAG